MKSKKITPIFIVALLLISSSFKLLAQPLNGVYAVGGTGSDFSDIYSACAALSSRGVSGPVEFNFSSGVTNCAATIALGNITGASLTNTITFSGNGHAIRSNVSPIIKIDGGGYLVFDGFDIAGAANFVGIAFWIINNSHDIAINSCVINVGIASASQGSACISTSQDPNAVNAGIHNIRHLKITNNQLTGGWACITMLNLITPDTNQSHTISNNKIEDFYSCGIYAHSGNLMEVNNNDISRPNRQNSHTVVYGAYFSGARTLRFNNNNIHHTGVGAYNAVAIYHWLHDDAGYLTSEITNNTISNINTTGSIYGFTFEQPVAYGLHIDSLKFYHNTIALNLPVGSVGEIRAVNISSVPATTTALIKNNILSISGNGSGNKYLVAKTSAVTLKSNYNLFDLAVTGGNNYIGFTGFSFHGNLSSWKNSTMDVNSISADPVFANIDCVNLIPLSGAGMNAGAGVGVLADKNGVVRSVSNPDIGAFEADSVINDLALVSAVIKPSNACYSDTVFFTVKNAK
ncbi:MAG: hypothetical protein V4658_11115, partial [Bacteroidota bacterium]